jgi:hypothetical protein
MFLSMILKQDLAGDWLEHVTIVGFISNLVKEEHISNLITIGLYIEKSNGSSRQDS